VARRTRATQDQPRSPDADGAAIDALYGLEPVIEPGAGGTDLSDFAAVDCPYCGERFEATVDLSAGPFCYVEDCQICCQPIELSGATDSAGALKSLLARRLD
jgi:hypothetical protein